MVDSSGRVRAPTSLAIEEAAAALRAGKLVAFPTETVYGLGGDATSEHAVAAIFATKGRPRFNPLISHVCDIDAAAELVVLDSRANELASHFWPGPLTLVLPRRPDSGLSHLVSAGLGSVAIRVPHHPIAQSLLTAVQRPLAAPSANLSAALSPTQADHVVAGLGAHIAMVLDGGPCAIGLESTVVDLTTSQTTILRPGGLSREDLIKVLGEDVPITTSETSQPKSPGMLRRHYAPATPMRLNATQVAGDEALLAFGDNQPTGAAQTLNLSPTGDLTQAAANLFTMLRDLDGNRHRTIAVVPIPDHGLGTAINDRLTRAASPHD